jgi:addiction module RelE/StbE family toxin
VIRVRWTDEARDTLRQARQYIARENPDAGREMAARIRAAAKHLADYPEMGRAGRIAGTRELVVPHTRYIVVYRARGKMIEILSVIHTAREWPQNL